MHAKTWLSLIFVFLLGLGAGILGTSLFIKQSIQDFNERGPVKAQEFILHKLNHDLKLTTAQKVKVKKIVGQAIERIEEIRQSDKPKVDRIIEGSLREIKAELNDEQAAKLDSIAAKVKLERAQKSFRFKQFAERQTEISQ